MKGKRVICTGGRGFIGSHLATFLQALGATVFSPPQEAFDLRVPREAGDMLAKYYPVDYVFNLAANTRNFKSGLSYDVGRDNTLICLNMITESIKHKVGKFIQIGTIASYPVGIASPFKEDDLWKGKSDVNNSSYGLSMRMVEEYLRNAKQQYGLPSVYIILPYLYGEGQHLEPNKQHTVAMFIQAITEAHKERANRIELWGGERSYREFMYVKDAVKVIVTIASQDVDTPVLNAGSGRILSLWELATIISELGGCHGDITWIYYPVDCQPIRALDSTRLRSLYNYDITDLIEGMSNTLRWYGEKSKASRSVS